MVASPKPLQTRKANQIRTELEPPLLAMVGAVEMEVEMAMERVLAVTPSALDGVEVVLATVKYIV